MAYQVLIIPLANTQAQVQADINGAVGGGMLICTSVFIGPYAGQNGLFLLIVLK